MRRFFAAALVAVAATAIAGGAAHGYPPADPTVTVSSQTPVVGSQLTVSYDGCLPTDSATFVLGASTATVQVVGGVATATLDVPTTPGTVTGSVTCSSGAVASFTVTVVAAAPGTGLPATGGSGIGATLQLTLALFVIGAGLYGVSHARRRQLVDA